MEVPEVPVTLVGLSVHVRPEAGETTALRFVVPPPATDTVIVEVPVAPLKMVTLVGLAVTVRPLLTLNVTTAE